MATFQEILSSPPTIEMSDMLDLWGFEEENNEVAQLGQKLVYITLELEKVQTEAAEEKRRDKECIDQLTHLLKCAIQERDEARDQLLLNNFSFGGCKLAANSSVTESNSLSETGNYHSSPVVVDSLFDGAFNSSSEIFVPKIIDQGSLIIDHLAKGRVLPQRGRFMEALLRADPLLQNLLMSGPLPSWRNPPLFPTPCEVVEPWSDQPFNISPDFGPLHVQPSPMLNYANIMPSMTLDNGMNGGVGYDPLAKRQRFI